MKAEPTGLLEGWVERQVPPVAFNWLGEQLSSLSGAADEAQIFKILGLMPRRLGKADLDLGEDDLHQARLARENWDPSGWTVDTAGRVLAVSRLAEALGQKFPRLFPDLCRSADVSEAIALYRGLPLYPYADALEAQAAEGLRTNMRAVFEAIAHRNPYPREQFDDDRWNQMVLKALFIGSRLDPIQGLDERANPVLALILSDYAHERWAAARPVSPELWRCLGPFAEGRLFDDLKRLAASGDPIDRRAAGLALSACPSAEARRLLENMPEIAADLTSGRLTWNAL